MVSVYFILWCVSCSTIGHLSFQDSERIEFFKESILASRHQIRQGAFRVSIRQEQDGGVTNTNIFHAFDDDRLIYRTDREVFNQAGQKIKVGGQMIQTPTQRILSSDEDEVIGIVSINRALPGWAEIFDFRSLGMAFYGDVSNQKSFQFVWEAYCGLPVTSIEEKDNHLVYVVWNKNRNLIFDKLRGHWPIQFRKEGLNNNFVSSNLELVQVNDLWVPLSYKTQEKIGDNVKLIAMEFAWESVNEELDPAYFDYNTFQAKKGTKVVDFSLPSKPVTVEIIGNDTEGIKKVPAKVIVWPYVFLGAIACLTIGMFFFRRHG
ncbi:MAG: hypothetical protein AAF623_18350 [Planctomycetota bacterium]